MSNSIAFVKPTVKVIVGVDTHKHVHVAVAIDLIGTRLATYSAPADRAGYADLIAWARTLGTVEAFGIEGPAPTASDSRASFAGTPSVSSRSTMAIGASVATTARTTPSMPRLRRGRCSPGSQPPSQRPQTGPQKWSDRSRSPAIRP